MWPVWKQVFMAIAVVEISGNGGAYLVEALRTEGLSTVRASNVQEAGASETALILVGAPPGDPWRSSPSCARGARRRCKWS